MTTGGKIFVGVGALVLLGGGAYLLLRARDPNGTDTTGLTGALNNAINTLGKVAGTKPTNSGGSGGGSGIGNSGSAGADINLSKLWNSLFGGKGGGGSGGDASLTPSTYISGITPSGDTASVVNSAMSGSAALTDSEDTGGDPSGIAPSEEVPVGDDYGYDF